MKEIYDGISHEALGNETQAFVPYPKQEIFKAKETVEIERCEVGGEVDIDGRDLN